METFTHAGFTFDVRDGGPPGGQPVILLHGFPETSASWAKVSPALNGAGHRTLAPDQRGYSPRARPHGVRNYRVDDLVGDVLALADQAGAPRFHLVGHDWGGIVAWFLAARHPDRLASLAVLSTPHPRAFVQSLLRSTQALHSWYMLAFQIPRLPEAAILARGTDGLRKSLASSGLDEASAQAYAEMMQQEGALTAAINWYRALPRSTRAARALPAITVPTLYVWSTKDPFLSRAAAEATARHVTGPYRFEVLEGSHWIPEEHPDEVAAHLLRHFEGGLA